MDAWVKRRRVAPALEAGRPFLRCPGAFLGWFPEHQTLYVWRREGPSFVLVAGPTGSGDIYLFVPGKRYKFVMPTLATPETPPIELVAWLVNHLSRDLPDHMGKFVRALKDQNGNLMGRSYTRAPSELPRELAVDDPGYGVEALGLPRGATIADRYNGAQRETLVRVPGTEEPVSIRASRQNRFWNVPGGGWRARLARGEHLVAQEPGPEPAQPLPEVSTFDIGVKVSNATAVVTFDFQRKVRVNLRSFQTFLFTDRTFCLAGEDVDAVWRTGRALGMQTPDADMRLGCAELINGLFMLFDEHPFDPMLLHTAVATLGAAAR